MTLQEAMAAKSLMILKPFVGFKPCGRLTGRHYYADILDKEELKHMQVEVKTSWLTRKFVPLSLIREVKDVSK